MTRVKQNERRRKILAYLKQGWAVQKVALTLDVSESLVRSVGKSSALNAVVYFNSVGHRQTYYYSKVETPAHMNKRRNGKAV